MLPCLISIETLNIQYLYQLKPTLNQGKQITGGGNIVFKLLADHDELLIHQFLHRIQSPHNHTIPLLEVIPSDIGPIILMPPAWPLNSINIQPIAEHLMSQLMEGIRFMHQHKVAHLNLKPNNILVRGEQLWIINFSLSVRVSSADTMI